MIKIYAFFHSCVNFQRRKNNIVVILSGDRWVEGVDNVRKEVKGFFLARFSEQNMQRLLLDAIDFKSLPSGDNSFLTTLFFLDEIEEVVWSCDGDKRPVPDGFNFTFLKKFRSLVKQEVKLLVNEFYQNSCLPKGIWSSFIALIQQRDNP